MTGYQSAADIVAERLQGLLAEDRAEYENTCCARCRSGTPAHGNMPCGNTTCRCHRPERGTR